MLAEHVRSAFIVVNCLTELLIVPLWLGAARRISLGSAVFRLIRAYRLVIEDNMGTNSFERMRHAFPELALPSLRSEMKSLLGITVRKLPMCRNSCLCYVGVHANKTECTYCSEPRNRPGTNTPVKEFHCIPLIQQVKALYGGYATAKAMRYRSEHANDNVGDPLGTMDDIYDSELYRKLAASNVVVAGHLLPHKFFEDPRDVLLIGQTDGFRIFKRSKQTC